MLYKTQQVALTLDHHGPMKLPLLAAVGLATVSITCPASAQEADSTGTGWELVRLDLQVKVDPAAAAITTKGSAQLRLKLARSAGPTLALRYFDYTSVSAGEAKVDTTDRHPGIPSMRMARIELPEPVTRGAIVEVEFETVRRELASQLYIDTDVALASWTMAWYPFPLPPGGRHYNAGDSRAPGTMRFELPKGWRALSEGRRTVLRETDTGMVEAFAVEQSMARSFAAGPYRVGDHVVGDRTFAVYLLGRDADAAAEQAAGLAAAIEAMEQHLGAFPAPSYAIAEIPSGKVHFAGASQQGFLMADSASFRYGKNLPLFAHEAAHAWWGNAVGTHGPGAILCSESLAQYGAVLAIEALEGPNAATKFLQFSRRGYSPLQCARGYFQMAKAGQDKPLSQLGSDGWQYDLSDAKGHWVFHMLRHRVGDDLFFATLRGLIKDHEGSSMSLDDVRGAFIAAAAPDRDLEKFFVQWLDRTGAPRLESKFEPATGGGITLKIKQAQAGAPYALRLDVALHHANGEVTEHVVPLDQRAQEFALATDRAVTKVELDPHHRLLMWQPGYAPQHADPAVGVETIAPYLGTYAMDNVRQLQIEARGVDRIKVTMGPRSMDLLHLGGHRFLSLEGVLEFLFEEGSVVAVEFTADDGRKKRAKRK